MLNVARELHTSMVELHLLRIIVVLVRTRTQVTLKSKSIVQIFVYACLRKSMHVIFVFAKSCKALLVEFGYIFTVWDNSLTKWRNLGDLAIGIAYRRLGTSTIIIIHVV